MFYPLLLQPLLQNAKTADQANALLFKYDLLRNDLQKAQEAALGILDGKLKKGTIPELWDGKAAERIVEILINKIGNREQE